MLHECVNLLRYKLRMKTSFLQRHFLNLTLPKCKSTYKLPEYFSTFFKACFRLILFSIPPGREWCYLVKDLAKMTRKRNLWLNKNVNGIYICRVLLISHSSLSDLKVFWFSAKLTVWCNDSIEILPKIWLFQQVIVLASITYALCISIGLYWISLL